VLRAIHLLLAFDLFVCVVAVDPRWVIQCLRASPGLVSNANTPDSDLEVLGGAATPSDYLEKIFQIPLWLRPVPAAQRTALIGTLLGKHLDRGEAAKAVRTDLENSAKTSQSSVARQAGALEAPSDAALREPERIKIKEGELAFLPRIAPLLDGNARALKRFVNTYRLVKTALSDVELEYFVNVAPYRICMTQLAVLATQRSRARLLVRLADVALKDELLTSWLKKLESGENPPETRALAADLRGALLPELEGLAFDRFTIWLERTRRYSFYL